jgi:hypothetical protein
LLLQFPHLLICKVFSNGMVSLLLLIDLFELPGLSAQVCKFHHHSTVVLQLVTLHLWRVFGIILLSTSGGQSSITMPSMLFL